SMTWGMGHLLLAPTTLDHGFGLRFVLRRASADELSTITMHALDSTPRTARTSIYGGASLESFGLEELGEVVSRLAAKATTSGLSSARPDKDVRVSMKGADALSLPLAKS